VTITVELTDQEIVRTGSLLAELQLCIILPAHNNATFCYT